MTGSLRRKYDHDGRQVHINHVHDELHRGNTFQVDRDAGSIADSATAEVRLTTGDREVHLAALVAATGAFLAELFEGTTFSSAGTEMTAFNKKRTSSKSASLTVRHSPTVDSDGTKLAEALSPGGAGPGNAISGGSATLARDNEWILQKNTEYLVRLTNVSGGSARAVMTLNWYEPELD